MRERAIIKLPLLLLLSACLALPKAGLTAAGAPVSAVTPAETAESQFQKLMEQDEEVQLEIESWLKDAQTNKLGADRVFQAALKLKIKKKQDDLTAAYEQFLKQNTNHVGAVQAYASFLQEAERDEEALKQLRKACDMAPDNAAAWNNLGNYYGQNGPATNAFKAYARAMELSPHQPLYSHNLARNLFIYQDEAAEFYQLKPREVIDKLQGLYRKTIELSPTNFIAATELAQSFYAIKIPAVGDKQKDLATAQKLADEALTAWTAAEKLAPGEKEKQSIYLHMARVQMNVWRFEEADRLLNQVNDPSLGGIKADLEVQRVAEANKASRK